MQLRLGMLLPVAMSLALGCLPNGSAEARGVHQRLETAQGPVHLWCGAEAPNETVVFVHGYELDADAIYAQHALAEQFQASGRNALFVVPEAPIDNADTVKWSKLEALLETVDSKAGIEAPRAVLVVGHSGGFRTIGAWLGSPLVSRVVLLDGVYGEMEVWSAWLARDDARLVVVSAVTKPRAEGFVKALDEAKRARVRHTITTLGHWALVSGRELLPRVIAEQPEPPPKLMSRAEI